jgi:hypothetical protein
MRGLRLMILGGGLFALSIVGSIAAEREPTYFGILFRGPTGIRPIPVLKWAKTPSLKQVEAAMPAGADSAGRTQWSCAVSDDGHLHDCLLNAEWPEHRGFGDAARSLLPLFQLSDETVRTALQTNAGAYFQIELYNAAYDTNEIPGDCPVPFCNPVIPPPPPPK